MSTASWTIDRETAEIIMPDVNDRNSLNLDNAWPRNGGLWSANSYEWCHVYDGGIDCVYCGIESLIDGIGKYGDIVEGPLEFATYEFTELHHCDCGVTLGGWEENCSDCGELCSTYDNAGLHLFGYIGDMELMGFTMFEIVFSTDDIPPADVYDSVRPICVPCLDQGYTYDHFKDVTSHPYGDTPAWKITPKGEEK